MSKGTASARMRRVLAILPWIISHGAEGASIEEACSRFGISRSQLTADLERVWMVGLYPYTPDRLIDVLIEGDRVTVRLAEYFSRPLRLTPSEALALVATGQGLALVPGADPDGPLARGVAKLAAALGVDAGQLQVELGEAASTTLEALQRAVEENQRVEIDYYTYGRDEHRKRKVEPLRVFSERGSWYLAAFDVDRDDERIFRLDRIESVDVLPERFDPPEERPEPILFNPGPDEPRVELELGSSSRWVIDQYPVEAVEELPDGKLVVTLAVAGRQWLERLLLRLGPDVTVRRAPEELEGVAAAAAGRILARYA